MTGFENQDFKPKNKSSFFKWHDLHPNETE